MARHAAQSALSVSASDAGAAIILATGAAASC